MILVFGKTGQLARELARRAPDAVFLGRDEADLLRPEGLPAIIRDHKPDAVINTAAFTAVDAAESTPEPAQTINAEAPFAIASACAELGIPLVHISSDYVFDGAGTEPFSADTPPAPINRYGASKWLGEQGIARAGGVSAILRTSWVFSAHGSNFVKTMLRLSETHADLRVVDDQIGGPTPAAALAEATIAIARALRADPGKAGTYHFAGRPDVSWAGFAREILQQAGRAVAVHPVASADYPAPARRPLNSRLDCASTEAVFGLPRPDWRAGLADVLQELGVCR